MFGHSSFWDRVPKDQNNLQIKALYKFEYQKLFSKLLHLSLAQVHQCINFQLLHIFATVGIATIKTCQL